MLVMRDFLHMLNCPSMDCLDIVDWSKTRVVFFLNTKKEMNFKRTFRLHLYDGQT